MPVDELFDVVMNSWTTQTVFAIEFEDSEAKKIMKEVGIS